MNLLDIIDPQGPMPPQNVPVLAAFTVALVLWFWFYYLYVFPCRPPMKGRPPMIVLRYTKGPGKLNFIEEELEDGKAYNFVEDKRRAKKFANENEADAFIQSLPWLKVMDKHGDIVQENV